MYRIMFLCRMPALLIKSPDLLTRWCAYHRYVLHILHLNTKMRGYFAEDILKHYTSAILRDDVFGVFVGEWCTRMKDRVGNSLGECLLHDDVSLAGFVMEELSHIRDQNLK